MLAEEAIAFSPSEDPAETVRFMLPSDAISIRDGLVSLFALDLMVPLTPESVGVAQIVLAEALNNVVKHAYAQYAGKIEIWVTRRESYLFIRIMDEGLAMPGGDLPVGKLGWAHELQEGGFGWSLIRNLSHDVTYARDGKRNLLSLCISVDFKV